MSNYKLLESVKVGSRIFKNRIVLPAMETRLNTPAGDVTQELIDYYAERARGGAAALIVENTFIDDRESRSSIISSGLYNDHLIKGKNLLAEAIQDNGALAIIQLNHGGRQASAAATGLQPVAPSALGVQGNEEDAESALNRGDRENRRRFCGSSTKSQICRI